MDKKTIKDIDVKNKKVFVRADLNVPLDDNCNITDETRIISSLPTINYLIKNKAKIILASHLGRPKGKFVEKLKMDPVAKALEKHLNINIKKMDYIISDNVKNEVEALESGGILLLENLRFDPGEKDNDDTFSRELAELADIYVNDAFGTSHRKHASMVGICKYIPSVMGLLLEKELRTLSSLLEKPEHHFVAILGGSKISDKIGVVKNILNVVDTVIAGGGMCYTFLKSMGFEIGKSLLEEDMLEYCKQVLDEFKDKGKKFMLPEDVIVAKEFKHNSILKIVNIEKIPKDWLGLDIGPVTIDKYKEEILKAKTILWNGPMGVFEWELFEKGTKEIAYAVTESKSKTVVGGGDTIAAVKKYNVADKISYITTGGGASLKFLEGVKLPAVEALNNK
mgnify:CR=1 FL=1